MLRSLVCLEERKNGNEPWRKSGWKEWLMNFVPLTSVLPFLILAAFGHSKDPNGSFFCP